MGCRYECKKYGKQRFKCCIECEQLNELLEEKTSDSGEDWYTAECLDRAIEIVKRGGRDEE